MLSVALLESGPIHPLPETSHVGVFDGCTYAELIIGIRAHWSWSYMRPVAQLIRILQQLIIKNRSIIELIIQVFLLV